MSFICIKDLTPQFRRGSILARVSRLWDYRGKTDHGEIQHVDMVLIDEQGTAIYGEIGPADIQAKKPLITEGNIYIFERFMVAESKKAYRPVESQYMINITYHTLIKKCPQPVPAVPLYVYNLTKFSDLPALIGSVRAFVDIIGAISEIGGLEPYNPPDGSPPSQRRKIIVRDTNQSEVNLTLWGQKAVEFNVDEVRALANTNPVVAIFVGLLVKPFRDTFSLSANAAARWYLNLDAPEVIAFNNKLKAGVQPIINFPEIELHGAATAEPQLRSVADIKATNPYDFPVEGFRCAVTFLRCATGQSWWFASCRRCSKKCIPDGDGYTCPRDGSSNYKFKYMLCYIGTDGTAEGEFMFFDTMGERLIGKDVRQLLRSCRGSDNIPSDIAIQIGYKYQLTVNVTRRALETSRYSYNVKKIDFAYGKQTVIPVISNPDQNTSAQNITTTIDPGQSSNSPAVSHEKTPPSPFPAQMTQDKQVITQTTPPPSDSPSQKTSSPIQLPNTQPTHTETNVRRALYKHDTPVASDAEHHAQDLQNSDADNNNSEHSNTTGSPQRPPEKSSLPSKKPKTD